MTYQLEAEISRQIVDLCKWIGDGSVPRIEMSMSLTRDLRFDSLQLMQFFSGIEELYGSLALEDWFIEYSSGARDTIGSVVSYIAHALPLARAESARGAQLRGQSPERARTASFSEIDAQALKASECVEARHDSEPEAEERPKRG
ncbi:MAG TPA: acyl carrier protein [Microvirga sp.]|nr:acyl carrier protein [Microvirga sp.]